MAREKRKPTVRTVWQLVLVIVGVVAVVQELRKPKAERKWHGKVFEFVPYDFRVPTIERLRDTYWNPGGSVISGKLFGVGWAPNFGAINRLIRSKVT